MLIDKNEKLCRAFSDVTQHSHTLREHVVDFSQRRRHVQIELVQ